MGIIREAILENLNENLYKEIDVARKQIKKAHEEYLQESKRANKLFRLSYERKIKITNLNSEIKHLTDLQANQDKEVEILRGLLKECKNIVAHDLWSRAQFPDGQVVEKDDILTRINAAIGESEE